MGRVEEILTKMNVEAANIAAELASKKVQEIAEMIPFIKAMILNNMGEAMGCMPLVNLILKKSVLQGLHKEELLLLQVVCLDITTKGLM